jgi:flagellar basal-body rod protein FlgG
MRALNTAATGMQAQELNIEVIANNIANMRTTGYKRQRAEFQDLLYEHIRRIGTQTSTQGNTLPVGVDLGSGVKVVGTPRIMTYTRDGSFHLDSQARIVTAEGNLVQPNITVPQNATALTINNQGQVSVIVAGSTTPTVLGQLVLTRFINKAGLLPVGDNLFTETPASGTPQDGLANVDGMGDIQQGNLEQANVEPVKEIADLIASQRAYEINSKVITATDQMLQSVIGLYR